MKKEPKIEHFIDKEEQFIIESIEKETYQVGKSYLNSERIKELQAAARETMNEERSSISIRVPKSDLSRIKAKAMQEGIPYQTLINSILHKAVNS